MQQQALNYTLPVRFEYGRWVRHVGVEQACSRIALWLVRGGILWLTSDDVTGKTHFLSAIASEHPHVGLISAGEEKLPSVRLVQRWMEKLEPYASWAIDLPAGAISRTEGVALFHLIERAREMNRPLLISWRCSESELAPPELASRMRMMERTVMLPPQSDSDLRAVMQAVADGLQWKVKDSVLSLMASRLPRSLPEQIRALTMLESASLAEQQRITQSWAMEKLNLESS